MQETVPAISGIFSFWPSSYTGWFFARGGKLDDHINFGLSISPWFEINRNVFFISSKFRAFIVHFFFDSPQHFCQERVENFLEWKRPARVHKLGRIQGNFHSAWNSLYKMLSRDVKLVFRKKSTFPGLNISLRLRRKLLTARRESSQELNLEIAVFRRSLQATSGRLYGFLPQIAISPKEWQHEAESSGEVPQYLVSQSILFRLDVRLWMTDCKHRFIFISVFI